MGHSSFIEQGLNTSAPEIKMLIRVAPRPLRAYLSLEHSDTCPKQPHSAREDGKNPGSDFQLSTPQKYAAWKPRPGRPWIACE